jgi:hypothetical protein
MSKTNSTEEPKKSRRHPQKPQPKHKWVASTRLVRSKAALLDMTLSDVSDKIWTPGTGYIHKALDNPRIQLVTVAAIAEAVGATVPEIIEVQNGAEGG